MSGRRLRTAGDDTDDEPEPEKPGPGYDVHFCTGCKKAIPGSEFAADPPTADRCLSCNRPYHLSAKCLDDWMSGMAGTDFICKKCRCAKCASGEGLLLRCVGCDTPTHLSCADVPPRPDMVKVEPGKVMTADAGRWYCTSCKEKRCIGCREELNAYITEWNNCVACGDRVCADCEKRRFRAPGEEAGKAGWLCVMCEEHCCTRCLEPAGLKHGDCVICVSCKRSYHQGCKVQKRGMTLDEHEDRLRCQAKGEYAYTMYDWVCERCNTCDICMMRKKELLLLDCDTCGHHAHAECLDKLPGRDILSGVWISRANGAALTRVWRCDKCKPTRCGLCDAQLGGNLLVTCEECSWVYHRACVKKIWKEPIKPAGRGFYCKFCPSATCMACAKPFKETAVLSMCSVCLGRWHARCLNAEGLLPDGCPLDWTCDDCA